MFRKFSSFLHKELSRVTTHSKSLPLSSSQRDAITSKCDLKDASAETKQTEKQLSTIKPLKRFQLMFEKYQGHFRGDSKFNSTAKEEFLIWCTGVLTVSSAILSHKWFNAKERRDKDPFCPVHTLNTELLQKLLLGPFHKSHVVLAINAPKEKKNDQNESDSHEAKLESIFAKYKETTDQCNGSFLNGLAVRYGRLDNHKQAFALFNEASELGNPNAWYNKGISYEMGLGTKKSYKKAAECYMKAGEQGHPKALYNLASLHYSGLLGSKEVGEGFHFMKQAADLGIAEAQLFIGLQSAKEKDWTNAFNYFELGAKQKNASSIYNLAICYENGYGASKNIDKAMTLYKESAEKGHALSQIQLGESFLNGDRGFNKDFDQALYWFKKADEEGHPEARSRIELAEYEIAQKNEDDLLTLFESNTLLKVLAPIQNALESRHFHKSASMPSLQKTLVESHPIRPFLLRNDHEFSHSTQSLCL